MGASMADGKFGFPFGPQVGARYADPGGLVPQGISAELIADKWGLTREDLDAFGAPLAAARAREPPTRAASTARSSPVLGADGQIDASTDEGLREHHDGVAGPAEAVVQARGGGGRVTAGNSSQITDGASALLIMSEEKAKRPRAARRGPAS